MQTSANDDKTARQHAAYNARATADGRCTCPLFRHEADTHYLHSFPAIVYLLHGDRRTRDQLSAMLDRAGHAVSVCAGAAAFWSGFDAARNSCLVLDPDDRDDPPLQAQLAQRRAGLPLVFVGAGAPQPVAVAVHAMKAGAVDFLAMPVAEPELIEAVASALALDRRRREHGAMLDCLRVRLARLSRREKQVFELVVAGMLNREMADALSLSEASIKIHRSNAMRKMDAASLADLVRMDAALHSLAPMARQPC